MRALALALLGGLLAGCSTMPTAPVPVGDAVIYVVGQGWHTDIGVPTNEVEGPLAALLHDFPGIQFAVFGFGQRHYYMAPHPDSGDMLAALFPSDSVLLITALDVPPKASPDQSVVMLRLPRKGMERITTRLWDELAKAADGSVVPLGIGPASGSVFYASNETYDALHTCNTWAAMLLRAGGLPINPDVVLAGQVMGQVVWLAAAQER